jgi:hypothetical protein
MAEPHSAVALTPGDLLLTAFRKMDETNCPIESSAVDHHVVFEAEV